MKTIKREHNMFEVISPATGEVVWQGRAADEQQVRDAVRSARSALADWQALPPDQRIGIIQRFGELASQRADDIADAICLETGKPRWEAMQEAKLVPAKVALAVDAYHERTGTKQVELPNGVGRLGYRPVGVMAVLGPFNFPAHLPNGHIVPALAAGNTVVFKPSEYTPGTGRLLADFWNEAGLPDGVLRIVQGARDTGAALVGSEVDGVLFTGSYAGGRAIHRALAGRPEVLLALEMGGNNPIVVHDVSDLDAAAYTVVVSAFITAGQRCTCARRLVVPDGEQAEALLQRVVSLTETLRVGPPDDEPAPFMGPVISADAGRRVLAAQADLIERGASVLIRAAALRGNPALLSPGVLDVTTIGKREDEEVFGPLLQVVRVPDFDAALAEANRSAYGLAASLLSDDTALFDRFKAAVRAGVVNWNQPTIGASGRLPFGGLGASGNHRPSGYHAADYCADATASVESPALNLPETMLPGIGPAATERPA